MEIRPKFEKDINTINFAPLIISLEARGKDPSLVFQRTGLDRKYLSSRRNYISLPTGIIIFNTIKEILGEKDPMLFYDLGLEVVKNQALGGLLTIGRALGDIEDSLRFLPRFNKKFNDLFEMTVLDIQKNSCTVIIDYKKKQYDGAWIFDQCFWNQGAIAGIPYEWDLPFIKIDEVVNRFSLREIIRDYAFMGHSLTVNERTGTALLNGQEFAVPAIIKTQTLRKAYDKIDKLNVLAHKEHNVDVLINNDYEIVENFNPADLKNVIYGMVIVKDTRISDRFVFKEGYIYAHPDCRISSTLHLSWTGKKKIARTIRDSTVGKWIYAQEIIAGYEDEMQLNLEQKRTIQEYADHLEEMVEERTAELKSAYQKLKQTQDELIQSEKLSAVSSIAYGIGHDFINILDTIQNNVYLLESVSNDMSSLLEMYKQSKPRDEITSFMEKKKISARAERISRLCDITRSNLNIGFRRAKFLEHYGKIKDDDSSYLRIEDIVTSVLDIYETKLHTAGVTINTHFTDTPYKFKSKQDDIYSIFDNLVRNSIEANATHIDIESQVVDGQYTIQVKDNGMGMQGEDKKRVFDLFFSTKKLDEDGRQRGIGLATVLKTVQDYGGQIHHESTLNHGTTFTVEFKIEQPNATT